MAMQRMMMQRMMNLEKEKKATLTRFYTDLYANKICLKLSTKEITDVREAVSRMVRRIANKVEEVSPRFKIGDVVLVGSASEETQIIRPDEYDFLLILETLSQPGVLEIKKTCTGNENCVHAIVKDNDVKRQFIDLIDGNELRSTQDILPFSWKTGLRESFYEVLKDVLHSLKSETIQTASGVLEIRYSSLTVHGPAFNPYFQWQRPDGTAMEISVDLCPVIRLKGAYPDVINLETVTNEVLILQHHYELMCTETTCLASCIERILHTILNIVLSSKMFVFGIPYIRHWLSNPFFKKHNIWSNHSGKFADRDLYLKLRVLLINLDFIGRMKEYKFENCSIWSVRNLYVTDFGTPWVTAFLTSLIAIYLYPDFGHSAGRTCRFLIWKFYELGRFLTVLEEPVHCKNENCCVSAAKRKKLRETYDRGLSSANICFMLALPVSILSVYIYPDFGHMVGDIATFLGRRLLKLNQDL